MDEKNIQDFKNSLLIVKEIRDRTKAISELADKLVRATEDPLYGLEVMDELGDIPTQINIQFMILQSFMETMRKVMGKEDNK